jgi:hypothetical protein
MISGALRTIPLSHKKVRPLVDQSPTSGEIVGPYIGADGKSHGYRFRAGQFTTFDPPGGIFTQPRGINEGAQIVGWFLSADRKTHGFLLNLENEMR